MISPVCSPMRMCTGRPDSRRLRRAMSSWISRAQLTARRADVNTAISPSPSSLTITPRWASTRSSANRSVARPIARASSSPSSWLSCVDSTRSVNSTVTVPSGMSLRCCITLSLSGEAVRAARGTRRKLRDTPFVVSVAAGDEAEEVSVMAGRDRASAGKEFETTATCLLRELTGNPAASFRDGQLAAIRELVVNRNRALVVQRTGWGKSAVYFIATRLLRDQGSGPTLLVSPLLALMRNQIEAARRMNVRAETINSDNQADWPQVVERIRANEVDLLLISPERLANRRFLEDVLDHVGQQAGLVVVDEAHCISDWGHDFRPDYRRIERVLELLPPGVPVLACTATANDRVVDDVVRQLGDRLTVFRGPLARAGLALQVITLDAPAARLAWLSTVIPTLDGSGIVYCLTVRDAETVSAWLRANGIDAVSYTGGTEHRPDLERALL